MTFPFQPRRSSSEDDALDQALNAWASGVQPEPANDLAEDALEFHRWADDARRTDSAATGPAAGTWNRVLHHVEQKSPRGKAPMSTATASVAHDAAIVYDSRPYNQREWSWSKFTNIAATVAIVLAISVGGWFAMSQLPPGGDGHFAALQGTPESAESATCDVEPMTVDEVMEIVENPYHYMDESEFPNPIGSTTHETPWEDEYQEVQPRLPVSLNVGLDTEPTTTAFDQASEVIAEYVACLQTDGSVAMMLRFADPFSIQHHIRMEFPFYRTEDQVRPYVSEWIASGTIYHELSYERQGETLTYIPANDKEMAGTQIHDFGLGFDQVIYVGSEIYDENGEFVGNFHPTLYMTYDVDEEYLDHGVVFTLLHSRYTGEWYVVTEDWMQLNSVI